MWAKTVVWILTCFLSAGYLSGDLTASALAVTYNATVSDVDQQTVKGLGGALPWLRLTPGCPESVQCQHAA